MANPLLKDEVFEKNANSDGVSFSRQESMTISGTINKSIILLLLLGIGAFYSWTHPQIATGAALTISIFAAFILAMICSFKPNISGIIAPIYALCEGFALGAISLYFNSAYNGIVAQAVLLTIAVLFSMLAAYRAGILRATPTFVRVIVFATMGVLVFYLINMVMSFFGYSGYFSSNSNGAFIINLVIVVIAALNFIIDFGMIDNGVKYGAPKYMEWYCSFALMVTLVWLYLEILRLLARRR